MKKILSMLLVLCMALTLCSAAFAEGKSPVDGMTVAFIPKVSGNSFFEAANDGAQKYAKEWGLTVDYIGAPTADVTTQLELIQQAIDKGVDAICISSVDATGLDEKLQEAQDAGIYVSTWDSDVSPNARALMVSQGTADVPEGARRGRERRSQVRLALLQPVRVRPELLVRRRRRLHQGKVSDLGCGA